MIFSFHKVEFNLSNVEQGINIDDDSKSAPAPEPFVAAKYSSGEKKVCN